MTRAEKIAPWVLLAICAVWLVVSAIPRTDPADEFHLHEFGKIPIGYEGRVKPYDSFAQHLLRALSGKSTALDPEEDGKKVPAIRWFLDSITQSERSRKYRVFRIVNFDVLDALGLQPRKGYLYSIEEFGPSLHLVEREANAIGARDREKQPLDTYETQLIQFMGRAQLWRRVVESHSMVQVENVEELKRVEEYFNFMMRKSLPLPVPPKDGGSDWKPFMRGFLDDWKTVLMGTRDPEKAKDRNPAMIQLVTILSAYAQKDVKRFNEAVRDHHKWLAENTPSNLTPLKISLEHHFMGFQPFYVCSVLYLIAFLVCCVSWMTWHRGLTIAATSLIAMTLIVHSIALVERIYISGRPPVTNLYSSAVFIGWASVLICLLMERVYKNGLANVVGSVVGFISLLIAYFLALEGDTFQVLQAVLDTNFWLATHVVCITFGYATTFVAGLFGIVYILRGLFSANFPEEMRKDITRMIYGILAFALFFSFVGTVLGGLWADDSWGRFWGWDPKENGALLIVLWNAIILHARWGGMAKQRGIAVLAVVGNMVTAWSWFGTNALGKGLHAYGQADTTWFWLWFFWISQMMIVCAGLLPKSAWRCHEAELNARQESETA